MNTIFVVEELGRVPMQTIPGIGRALIAMGYDYVFDLPLRGADEEVLSIYEQGGSAVLEHLDLPSEKDGRRLMAILENDLEGLLALYCRPAGGIAKLLEDCRAAGKS